MNYILSFLIYNLSSKLGMIVDINIEQEGHEEKGKGGGGKENKMKGQKKLELG